MKNSIAGSRGLLGVARLSALIVCATTLVGVGTAQAGDACREWRKEHSRIKGCVLALLLSDAEQRRIDHAMFELLQRESYLTSCEVSARDVRTEFVGWRLAGRNRDEFAVAVAESVLEGAGFELDLTQRLALGDGYRVGVTEVVARPSFSARRRSMR